MREVLGPALDKDTTERILSYIRKTYINGEYDAYEPIWQQISKQPMAISSSILLEHCLPNYTEIYVYIAKENSLHQVDFEDIRSNIGELMASIMSDIYLFDKNLNWIAVVIHPELTTLLWELEKTNIPCGDSDSGGSIDVDCEHDMKAEELDGVFDNLDNTDGVEEHLSQYNDLNDLIESEDMKLKMIVGQEAFISEMKAIGRFAEFNRRLKKKSGISRLFPYHYIFTIEPGMGLTTFLQTLTDRLNFYGMINSEDFIEYDGSLAFVSQPESGTTSGVFQRGEDGSYRVDSDYGVVAVNISKNLTDPNFSFERFLDILWDLRGKVLFVLVLEERDAKETQKLINRIKSRINCHYIPFRPYTDQELVQIGKTMLEHYGFQLDQNVECYLLERICMERENSSFEHLRTIQKIIEEVRVERLFNHDSTLKEDEYDRLRPEDFTRHASNGKLDIDEVWSELDAIVGLETVKTKLKEITAQARTQRELSDMGIDTPDTCYHMIFTGNPGTGKTTVARILGRMFKAIGVLSRGDLIETGREGLVARYVGQTAPKVREKVRTALGSVLFIDEAYSLNGGTPDRLDFGYEAIDTLVKEMEDKRDDLVVIMAGYTEDMKKLFEMNSGLSERIPYHIEFPDYNSSELTEIFARLLGADYRLQENVREKVQGIFDIAAKNADKDFGNGRLARNIAERLRVKQSMRLCQQDIYNKEALLTITLEDVEALLKDDDILRYLSGKEAEKNPIGFI